MTSPVKRKSEQIEKQKNLSPLRRSERDKMLSSSGSLGSKKSDTSPGSLDRKRKKEKEENSVKPLTTRSVEVKQNEQEDGQGEAQKKRMDARAYRALLRKTPQQVDRADHCGDLNRTDCRNREVELLEKLTERTHERSVVASTNQSVKEAFEKNDEHKSFSTCQKDSCKDMSSTKDVPQIVKNRLVHGEVNDDAGKAMQENLRSPKVNCGSKKQETCSFNANQLFGSSDTKDRGEPDVGISTGHAEKPCSYMQQCISSADLQTCNDQNTCIVCKLDGKLLRCHGKGCQRSYHLSCLEPPLEEFHLGVWYCLSCVRKKLESGVYSVSEGIEAIWDSRELEALEDGLRGQKQYFVKYKGLAHVHNCWLPENQVLLEAPSLVAKYNRKNQGSVWKQHWAVPHHLLQKRLLITKECDRHCNGHDDDKLCCHVEWLVKWCGLGYEHASWELDNASFFRCPEGQSLMRDYETCFKKGKKSSKFKDRAGTSLKFSQLPAGVSSGIDANLDSVSKLSNHWPRSQNAVIFDNQERIPNVISFIMSFPSDKSRPFLIISTSTLLNLWDEEFLRLEPATDVVVYSGSKEIRNSIRNLEFYEGGGCVMFQVLITSPEVVSEDLNVLDCIGWEVIILDECQRPTIASCFEQIKMFTASKRLLIISSQLKDNVVEYLNLLSLLDSESDSNGSDSLQMTSSDNIAILKERLAKYVAYESSRFVEYWVPVLLSIPQLDQYCFTLLSNSLSLCSPSKTDPVGALRNILITSRKCCDHPYVVDESLQMRLTKGLKDVEFLDVGIKASGKLQLLDAILLEIKKQELKVLVLFQYTGGSGRDLMGDILDDFLRQRFGADSYERVDGGVTPSRKQSALNKFNNERKRFVFLLETRACLSSIKLSAISTVVIFGSDWSPVNDLRALQKITLDSHFEEIKVFRLYSAFTVEEKILMLSKQDKTLDSNIVNISPSSSHMLLKWGAPYLLSQLEKIHGIPALDASNLPEQSLLKDVIQEFFILLSQTGIDNDASKLSLILQAKQNQGMYRTEMPLFGEQKIQVMNEDPPHIFWTKLLEGKSPRWKYCSSFQRNRKRGQYLDAIQKKSEVESAEVVKRRKVVNDGNDHPSPRHGLQEDRQGSTGTSISPLSKLADPVSDKIHATNSIDLANDISETTSLNMVEWERRRKQLDSQKTLHVILWPQIAKLCEVLHLSEGVRDLAGKFLEYVMNNHLVNREPETILQAFQISLCWCTASLLKQKIDHKESLALAKQHLGFTCKKEEAAYVNSLLRCLKRMFVYRTGCLKVSNPSKGSELSIKADGNTEDKDSLRFQEASDARVIAESGVSREFQLAQRDLAKSINESEKKFDKQLTKLTEKQKEEMKQLKKKYEEEKALLENKKQTEAAVIRLHSNFLMRTNKIKNLDIEYASKFDELKQRMDTDLKNLEASQGAARSNVLERKTRWVEAVKSWARVELVKPPISKANLPEGSSSSSVQSAEGSEVRLSEVLPDKVDPIYMAGPCKENSKVALIEEGNKTVCLGVGEEQAINKDSCPKELVSVGELPNVGVQVPPTVSSGDVTESVLSLRRLNEDQISDEYKLKMSNGNPETVSPTDALENAVPIEACSHEEIPDGTTLSKPNTEVPLKTAKSVIICEGQNNLASVQVPSSEINSDIYKLTKVDGEVPLKESVVANFNADQETHVSAEAPSSEKIPDGAALGKAVGDICFRTTKIVNSSGGQENVLLLEAPSPGENPVRTTLSNLDGEVHLRAAETVSSREDHENLPSLVAPSSEKISCGTTLTMVEGELALNASEVGQGNIISANTSSEKEILGGATLNVLDGEVPNISSEIASSSDDMNNVVCTNPSTSKEQEQIPDTAALSMPAEEISLAEPETACSELLEGGSAHRENDGTCAIEIDRLDGILCFMNLEPEFQERSLADPSSLQAVADLVSPNVGSLPYASSGIQTRDVANNEMRNASQVAETLPSNGAVDVTCNVSNPDTQQLRSTESILNLSPDLPSVSATEHQPSNDGQHANLISQAQRQSITNHIDLSSQDVLQPLHSPINGTIGRHLRQVSETSTASVPSVSRGHPLQTAPPVSSRMPLPLYPDPLKNEMERISQERDQTIKVHEDTKLQLKFECEKEIEEVVAQVRRKYEVKLQEKETEFLIRKEELDVNYNKVLLNNILAEAFRSKCMDSGASGSAGIQQEANSSFMQQLLQLSSQRMVQQPSTASGLPSTGSATSMQTVSPAVVNTQTMGPSLWPSGASGLPSTSSGTTTRPPCISSVSRVTGNFQMGSEIRAPAPHLHAYRPSASISLSSVPSQSRGMSSQLSHNLAYRQLSTTGQAGRIRHEIAGGLAALPNSSLRSMDVLMGMHNQVYGANPNPPSNLLPGVSSSLALSIRSNPAQQGGGATDIVCLSDDD
ncbi:hypothetical protein ES319_D08G237600v1 [Gossypium barbadense]|uniref:PHD-type domain-containing protein n=2 Tax=Gossypium TaxID=3633 RepID=A0A5J5QI54_GOSBA|nr:hypothetical protein ES319_D08G237600v1 [Gossypium barbadense]KAB2018566.1 hypothetical protein ES319_D08G237600v1 [Gossypium barbadense]TYG58775.1 hypothetical protein ES288_D08G249400v1 [Gossypium darwinii]TYG58776.1 hypothetical protein ES288_D08G249400v1 [Gossypium darwinii]